MNNKCTICNSETNELNVRDMVLRKCGHCDFLWVVEPTLSTSHYELKGDDEGKYHRRIRNTRSRVMELQRSLGLDNLCDVGAGDGTFLIALKEAGYTNIIGIDPNTESVELAKKGGVEVLKGDVSSLPTLVKERKIKTISLFHVIEHFDHPGEIIKNIYTSLPNSGHLILETPNSDAYLLKKSGYNHDLVYPEHRVLFNDKNLAKLLKQKGFKIKKVYFRDFDVEGVGIKDLLIRLGFFSYIPNKERMLVQKTPEKQTTNQGKNNLFKMILQKFLITLCSLLRRWDYVVIVAQKVDASDPR